MPAPWALRVEIERSVVPFPSVSQSGRYDISPIIHVQHRLLLLCLCDGGAELSSGFAYRKSIEVLSVVWEIVVIPIARFQRFQRRLRGGE